ncbi:MAG: hypothetical protein ACOY4W_16660 [Thermodesulfobacteriota bacterium]
MSMMEKMVEDFQDLQIKLIAQQEYIRQLEALLSHREHGCCEAAERFKSTLYRNLQEQYTGKGTGRKP